TRPTFSTPAAPRSGSARRFSRPTSSSPPTGRSSPGEQPSSWRPCARFAPPEIPIQTGQGHPPGCNPMNRRQFLHGAMGAVSGGLLACGARHRRTETRPVESGLPPVVPPAGEDDAFLDDLSRAAFRYFVEAAHPVTGHVLDRRLADGSPESRRVASIAATGFGLAALAIGHARGWAPDGEIVTRVRRTLRHLHDMEHVRGFFFHFHDWETGGRVWNCELSSIDTAILLCGALTCRGHFEDAEIRSLAERLYHRVEWPWMLNGGQTLCMGWKPESGFLESRW